MATLVACATLGLLMLAGLRPHDDTGQAGAQVEHTLEVLIESRSLLSALQEAESNQRGYLLTLDPAHLTPYEGKGAAVVERLAALARLTAGSPAQQARLAALRTATEARLAELAQVLELAQGGSPAGALAAMRRAQGRQLMQESRRLVGEIIAEEERQLAARREQAAAAVHREARLFRLAALAALLATLGGSAGMALLAWRQTRTERAAAARLAGAEAHQRDLLATIDLGAFMARDMDGTIRHWSRGCERLYGWTAEEALGRLAHELLQTVFPVPRAAIEAGLEREGEWAGDLRQHTRDGRELIVAARKVLRRTAEGGPERILEVLADVTDQRRAEAALAESEARLRLAQEAGGVGVFERDLATGRAYWSAAMFRLYGLDPGARGGAEVTEAEYFTLVHPEDRERLMAQRAALRADPATERFALEFRIRRADTGEIRWITSQGEFLRDTEGRARLVRGAQHDVTERRRAEAELAASEARFRSLAEALPALIFVAAPDGGVTYVNRRYQDYTGLPAEALLGHGWLPVVHPQDRAGVVAAWEGAVAQGTIYGAECRLLRHDGTWRWHLVRGEPECDAAGRILRWTGTCTDIDDLRRAEAGLAESEARLRSIVETAADGILVADAEGRITAANPAALRMFGYGKAAELIGRNLGVLMPQAEATRHDTFLDVHRRGTDGGAPARAIAAPPGRELTGVRRDGSEFPIELSVASFSSGGERFFTGVVRDVTERRREEEMRRLLAREVDHRAKNALAVALSLLRLTPRDDAARFAASVEGRIAAMARAHSLLATRKWVGADLREIAEGELASHAGRVSLSGPAVWLAPEAVQPVAMLLHELATNAAKYGALSRDGGRVLLSWELGTGEEAGLRLRWEECGGPPVQAPSGRRGFGSRLIASLVGQQLAGAAEFDWSASGLVCTLRLGPRCATAAEPSPPSVQGGQPASDGARERRVPAGTAAAAAGNAGAGKPPRVLAVEDEALLALELEGTLGTLGCEVVGPARTLAEAVRLAASEPDLDAAVLDVNLGGGDFSFPAVDVLQTRGVPYVFATGYGSVSSLHGRDHGAVAVLIKPYPREAMADALGAALGRKPGAAEPLHAD